MLFRRLGPLAAVAVLVSALGASAAPAPVHVSFRSTDGTRLRGHLWARGPNAVVFSHMFGTTQSIWYDLAGKLAAQGYTVLTFDFRGVGTSSGKLVIRHVYRDTLAAVRFMRGWNPEKIVVMGASMGGTSSIVAAGQTKVDGLVVIASGMMFRGLDARPYLTNLQMPKLFIVGTKDAPFNQSARTMHERTPEPKRLLMIPTAAHGTYMFRSAAHREAIYEAIFDFLSKVSQ